ncbi:MAG: hypothetical protein KJN62_02480 [Deltaproteobacteria bacterium]|nr:hypothetical protein [Deltaproteobacteria bacterium]
MGWEAPRNWVVEALTTTMMNSISEDLRVLHRGNGYESALSNASADSNFDLNIGETDAAFTVNDDTYAIKYISIDGRQPGNIITLINGSSQNAGFANGTETHSGYAQVKISSGIGSPYSMCE